MIVSGRMEQELSHYRIIKKLGAGGMGQVYLAEDKTLGRQVALKLLSEEYTQDEERLRRFKQEAKAASALNHPNILIIYEVGEARGHHFIATEFIDGETLRARLKRSGSMQINEALDLSAQVASALVAAHQAGIVHRDIKPENIMLRPDGYAKVLDFGLAKLAETETPQSDVSNDPTQSLAAQTRSGAILGTPQYMSPEQTTGKKVDARSDIFAFGAVLYEILSGQRAFEGGSTMEIIAALINQEPKPLPPKVPAELAKVILRCLRKDPSRRFQTMADLKVALQDLQEEYGKPRKFFAEKKSWTWPALSLMTLIFLLLLFLSWRKRPALYEKFPLSATTLTTLAGVEQSPSISPDGNYVAFTWTGPKQDNEDIYIQMIGSGSPLALTTDPLNDYNPVWSPDGHWIAFLRSQPPSPTGVRNRELWIKPPLGGSERKIADLRSQDFFPVALYLAWSPNNKALIVTDSSGEGKPDALFVVSLESGEKRQLTKPIFPVLADTSPAISPDGNLLVFLRRTTWGAGELHLLQLGKDLMAVGKPRRLTSVDLRADFPAWMPDGKEIVFAAKRSLWRLRVSSENSPARIPYIGEDALMPAISLSQTGARLVYVRSFNDWNFWRIETSALGAPSVSPPVMAISSTKAEYHCQFSPDGKKLVFTSDRSGDAEIWVSDPDGSNAVQITSMGGAVDTNCPHWSPDGKFIVFSSTATGEFDVYVVPVTGGKPRRLTSHPAIDLASSFSLDGKWIYFNSMRSGDYRVWKMPVAGGDAIQVTPNLGTQVFEASDGSIYYLEASIVSPVWHLPASGGLPKKILDGVIWFNFCLVGNGAYYIDRPAAETRLQYLNFATGKSITVANNLGEVGAWLTAAPDGKTILFMRVDASVDDLMLVENFR